MLITTFNVNMLTNNTINTYAEETNNIRSWEDISSWEDLNYLKIKSKTDYVNFSQNITLSADSIYTNEPIFYRNNSTYGDENFYISITNYNIMTLNTSAIITLYNQDGSSASGGLWLPAWRTTEYSYFMNLDSQHITTDLNSFISIIQENFDIIVEPETFLNVMIDENYTNNIKNITLSYIINNQTITKNIAVNSKILISEWVEDGSSNLIITINYINLPLYYFNLRFNNMNYYAFIDSESNVKYSSVEISKGTTINNNEELNIYVNDYIPTINLLTNTTWFLNPTINFDYESIHHLSLIPTETARQGYYIAYNYNVNEVINEYMYFNDDEFPNNYNYLINVGTLNTLYDYKLSLYDNVNYINGQLGASGVYLYSFNDNSYLDNFGVVPRIVSFSHLFNTNNLQEDFALNDGATNTELLTFYEFLTTNATEFTAEQYDTYNSGYNVGYNVGVDFGTESTKWISAVFGAVDDIFQVEILPNFKLWYLIGIPLLLLAVVFIFKLLR